VGGGGQMTRRIQSGWAVAAPDYAGLGTTGRPELLNKTGQAGDVIDDGAMPDIRSGRCSP
jgi:hypothetical protein